MDVRPNGRVPVPRVTERAAEAIDSGGGAMNRPVRRIQGILVPCDPVRQRRHLLDGRVLHLRFQVPDGGKDPRQFRFLSVEGDVPVGQLDEQLDLAFGGGPGRVEGVDLRIVGLRLRLQQPVLRGRGPVQTFQTVEVARGGRIPDPEEVIGRVVQPRPAALEWYSDARRRSPRDDLPSNAHLDPGIA